MNGGRNLTVEVIVLAAADVGEEDRILTFITPDSGLLRAAAGSARNLKKGKAAPLDLFVRTKLDIGIGGKGSQLKRVRTAQVIDPFLGIRADYEKLCVASYLGQTVAHCVQEDDNSFGTYELVHRCLKRLDTGGSCYGVMLLFEARFLREMGLSPQLDFCQKCGRRGDSEVYISASSGGIIHRNCRSGPEKDLLSGGDLAVLRFLSARDLSSALKLSVKDADALRIFRLLHTFSVHHLGFEAKALRMIEEGII